MAASPRRHTLPTMQTDCIHPAVRPGHVHLRVADVERALAFYRDLLGFAIFADARPVGLQIALLAAGDYHHHVALNGTETSGATPPPAGHTGLHHIGFLYPDRRELVRAVRRLLERDYPISHATDHGETVSVYLADPDANGLELYHDRPRTDWFDADGHPLIKADRFDPRELLPSPTSQTNGS
jgi:catechol 2,3-dioxygenase